LRIDNSESEPKAVSWPTSNSTHSLQQVSDFFAQDAPIQRQRWLASQSNDQIPRGQIRMLLAKDFPNQTANQISIHRSPQKALGNYQSQAGSSF
jgi:hypothetical protein